MSNVYLTPKMIVREALVMLTRCPDLQSTAVVHVVSDCRDLTRTLDDYSETILLPIMNALAVGGSEAAVPHSRYLLASDCMGPIGLELYEFYDIGTDSNLWIYRMTVSR